MMILLGRGGVGCCVLLLGFFGGLAIRILVGRWGFSIYANINFDFFFVNNIIFPFPLGEEQGLMYNNLLFFPSFWSGGQ